MANDSSTLGNLRHLEVRDNDLILRRLMSFNRLKEIIKTGTLHFPPASKFGDELEGHSTNRDHKDRESQLRAWGFDEREQETARTANQTVTMWNRQAVVISCWTRNATDHSRMWDDYAGCDEAVAIESTVGSLRSCLGNDFLIIPVRYIDFDREKIPHGHSLLPFFYKRAECFEWENEVRIIGEMVLGTRIDSPRIVPVDLVSLIQKITISPTAPNQFINVVRTLTMDSLPNVPIESP